MRCALTILLLCFSAALLRAETVLVHLQVGGETLTGERVRDMLLGRITTWDDGTPVTIVLVDDPAADVALLELVSRDRQRLLRGWKRLVYSGAGVMPLEASSTADAIEQIARTPGAIALVKEAAEDARVKCVRLGK